MKGDQKKLRNLLLDIKGLTMGEASGTLLALVVVIIIATVGALVLQSINDQNELVAY